LAPLHVARVAATAFCFFAFGVAGLSFGFVIAPALFLVVPNRARRQRITRSVASGAFRVLVNMMVGLRILTVDLGALVQRRIRGQVVVANHPTYIDVVFLLAYLPDTVCVFKRSILRNPVMAGAVFTAGYLVNRDGPELIDAAAKAVQSGSNLLVFPEGTRSPAEGGLHAFHRGAAHVSLRAGRPIVPIAVSANPPMLARGRRWYALPRTPTHFRFEVLEPIHVQTDDSASHLARRLTASMERVIRRALEVPLSHPPSITEAAN
jgi:1-acyl-sn-glycerol-3-phosphate acyltransferase